MSRRLMRSVDYDNFQIFQRWFWIEHWSIISEIKPTLATRENIRSPNLWGEGGASIRGGAYIMQIILAICLFLVGLRGGKHWMWKINAAKIF